jgi:hypothetical protein
MGEGRDISLRMVRMALFWSDVREKGMREEKVLRKEGLGARV